MTQLQTNAEIYNALQAAFDELKDACLTIPDNSFFDQPENKWSKAQHLQHIIISTQTSTAAFALPMFVIRLVGGKPKRPSLSYDELVMKYLQKLRDGGRASGRYIPKTIPLKIGKVRMLSRWHHATDTFLAAFEKIKDDSSLDKYQVPHPLLGKITLRELAYFTIYHTGHHKKAIVGL